MKDTQNTQLASTPQIAIVGMSLRFPGANSKAQFWHNLTNKVSSIREIPNDRWPWQDDFDPSATNGNANEQNIISKWGGFIEDIDGFDASFFAISPKEAQSMDPQQRISMELAWACFEDAGLRPADFKNSQTAVYLGCSNTDYQEFGTSNIDPHFLTGMSTGVFANRISHFFNFQGPSETVDTACSSSLVALHKAIIDFKTGEISAALVGGVNLLMTKSRYVSFSKLGVLSPNGRCKTLDASADGYVRGEGAGMILLMPYEQAIEMNASIYGIVKGSSIGHSGKTNTLTSPSPFSQSRVIQQAIESAVISSDQISMVELHGTGTKLGDPIEIQGLKRAFRASKQNESSCYLTTVKTNIGHLEPAAGIAGLIKILLSFDKQQIAPLQNFDQLNPKISLQKSPFKLATETLDWPSQTPRIAGISSFGFAGVNAHVLLQQPAKPAITAAKASQFILLLSAKTQEALQQRAQQLLDFIQNEPLDDAHLENLAYTLQMGREAMEHRFGFIARSMQQVKTQLQAFITNQPSANSNENDHNQQQLNDWLNGESIDWQSHYVDSQPQRISLPSYPFAKTKHWITTSLQTNDTNKLHPLLHVAQPSFDGVTFVSNFTANDTFLKHHKVQGQAILPGVCCLEMVRVAMQLSHNDEQPSVNLSQVVWLRPVIVETEIQLKLQLWQKEDETHFKLWSEQQEAELVHAQGKVAISAAPVSAALAQPSVKLADLTQSEQKLEHSEIYQRYADIGLHYGQSFRCIKSISRHNKTAVATLDLTHSSQQKSGFAPALLDSALQSLGIFAAQDQLALPFALSQVEFFNPPETSTEQVLIYAEQKTEPNDTVQKYDIVLCEHLTDKSDGSNESGKSGKIYVRFKGFSTRTITTLEQTQASMLHYSPSWQVRDDQEITDTLYNRHIFTIGDINLDNAIPLISQHTLIAEQLEHYTNQLIEQIKSIAADKQPQLLQLIIRNPLLIALSGLLNTAALEYAYIECQLILIDDNLANDHETLTRAIEQDAEQIGDKTIRYSNAQREVLRFIEQPLQQTRQPNQIPFKEQGVYLITGGLGKLGQLFAKEITHQVSQPTIILLGRKPQSDIILPDNSHYYSVDIANSQATETLIANISNRFGKIDGIIHSAGIIQDQLLSDKTAKQIQQVFAPKVAGLIALDEATKTIDLDFFVCFSSISAIFGNIGQADYATANRFVDTYMQQRQTLVLQGKRQGSSLSINWPLWANDTSNTNPNDPNIAVEKGMQVDDVTREMLQAKGIVPLPIEQGINGFYQAFSSNQSCFLYGDREKLSRLWQSNRAHQLKNKNGISSEQLMDYLKSVIAEVTGHPVDQLPADKQLHEFGLDSIMSMSIAQRLEQDFGSLPPTLLFEVNTLTELEAYLAEHHVNVEEQQTDTTDNEQQLPQDPMPLSKAQEGLWLLHKQLPSISAYNVPWVFEIDNFDLNQMQQVINFLCQKHPILTTTMMEHEGRPTQQLQTHIPVIDQRHISTSNKNELITKLRQHIQTPFDLSNQPLWRVECWHVNQAEQSFDLMVLVFHHIIVDGVSSTWLVEQLWNGYKSLKNHQALTMPTPDLGFFSYLEWEQQTLNNQTGEQLKAFWQQELQGDIPLTQLPNRMGIQQGSGEHFALTIDKQLFSQLNQYLKTSHINAPVFFLSAFQLLLSQQTGNQDITLGMPVLHRPKADMAQSLGLFVNQLPIRNQIDPQQDFSALCNSNQAKLINLINHSGYPFSEIVKASKVKRSHNHHPIFQIGYIYQNIVQQQWFEQNQDLIAAIWDELQRGPELEFSLEVTPMPSQYRLIFKYDTAVYPEQQINQFAQDYIALLEQIINIDHITVADYPLLATKADTTSATLVDLFEAQVSQTPDHIAVSFNGENLNYQQLNQSANALAQHLINQGVTAESRVAISVQPSEQLIIAILAILKAGAAYVPIDPNSAPDRMQFILQDAAPSMLISQKDSILTTQSHDITLIDLDSCLAELTPSSENINLSSAQHLAYIIYTSGSTGKPKGVLVEQHNVVQLFNNTKDSFEFSAQDTWCLFHSYAFDFSVWEIWGALLHGGKLAIPDNNTRKESAAFAKFIADQQITMLNQTPSAFFPLMDLLLKTPVMMQSLRTIIFGGEALELSKLAPWFAAKHPLPQLVNMYGITETTVHVTQLVITKALALNHHNKSIIGQALPGYNIHLLDEAQNPVAQGSTGEIYVGGCGVTRGYYQRPEITEQRFINSKFGRLYRSGDLARVNDEGQLEYIGRADDQVQIRGYRIELGEVTQALLSLKLVHDATTLAIDKQHGKVLVGYLVTQQGVSIAALRAELQRIIPEYMVPAHFVFVEKFSLTANGKIDKKALEKLPLSTSPLDKNEQQPQAAAQYSQTKQVASISQTIANPLQHIETSLAQIWQNELEVTHVDIDQPFFEAGGSSILANVLSAKVEAQFGIKFPLSLIFQYTTIREMAQYLYQQQTNQPSDQPSQQSQQRIEPQAQNQVNQQQTPDYYQSSIAIIGLSCHYPNSPDQHSFWQNLVESRDLVTRLNHSDNSSNDHNPQITWLDSWIDGQDHFDPAFFNISEKNARTLSYSARQLLMHSYKAVEDAGYNSDKLINTGVYVSSSGNDVPDLNLQDKLHDDKFVLSAEDYVSSTLNQPGTLPSLISYHLGFSGPSLFVHSNCSSSLSALSLACSALKANDVDYAIVGAACLYPQRYTGYQYEKGLNFAKDARCKTFAHDADGMVGGNGVAAILIKRAQDAINDADHIYSLIRGINVNNDGATRAGFFAPSTKGQINVIAKTLEQSQVDPATIGYVEAHGTGTALGDPIEFAALKQCFENQSTNQQKQYCGLGSVKSNLGHTDTLAGLTGVIKTALALHHKKLPASLHFERPNPQIDLQDSPFYLVDKTQDWLSDQPRRAAVSSFGIGGTNAHGILEEYPTRAVQSQQQQQPAIVVLSAANQQVLAQQVTELNQFIQTQLVEQQLPNLAYTLQTGRKVMACRTGFVVSSLAELQQQLSQYPNKSIVQQITSDHSEQQAILTRWLTTGFSDWDFLYQGQTIEKISLPTYPFALKAYRLPQVKRKAIALEQDDANLQLKTSKWQPKLPTNIASTSAPQQHHAIFCELPVISIDGVTGHSLFSSQFNLEQKIEDYGYQLLTQLKQLAQTKQETLVQLVLIENQQPNLYRCFHSLLKTASLELPTITTQMILLSDFNGIDDKLRENISSDDSVIRYRDNQRQVLEYHTIHDSQIHNPWQPNGVYLITGGLGGIGSNFIEAIKHQPFTTTIITTGRKAADHPDVIQQLQALEGTNTTLHYHQLDVSNKVAVMSFVRQLVTQHHKLNGVIHAAGIVQDQRLINKTQQSFNQVLAPKVTGVIALDEATQDLSLDFFVCFAGLSGVTGAPSQIDYATANAFLDSYMHYRDSLVSQGLRQGNSISIDWPYWKDGGMKLNPQLEKLITPMPTQVGINAFYQAFNQVQTLVEYQQPKAQQQKAQQQQQSVKSTITTTLSPQQLAAELSQKLQSIAASILGMEPSELDPNTDLGDSGADSIEFVSFINQINKHYQLELSPTVLFKHASINSLKDHILAEYQTELSAQQIITEQPESTAQAPEPEQKQEQAQKNKQDKLAIIGMSGQFPQADNLDQFWQNLVTAKDCISQRGWTQQVPSEVEWVGSISKDHDFDPLFFNISPAEGNRIQRQESLLMMHMWQCIEDAGYDAKSLAGSNTGVFIGCQSSYFEGMVTSPAFAPNRMSYFLDLHGPSEGIDTTCSSSLVALHKACQTIDQGDCDQAIVGGVNVIDSPHASLAIHQIGALSPQGRCKTFDQDADGFVRGEGVGMLFIKKLSASLADNDAIYGTILGSALNHGGKSQGFTVPNANAQARLLTKAWQNADIDPASLSYIECHGTGTSLGDPVEVDALKDAFKLSKCANYSESNNHNISGSVAIGSVKSNIGHLEIAAGIAGVIKVLLQFKHQTLVPSIHVKQLNPYLALDGSPFKVQTKTEPWTGDHNHRAAVSSFGISGVNAHVVLEQFSATQLKKTQQAQHHDKTPTIIVLSAASERALNDRVKQLSHFLKSKHLNQHDCDLTALAYTLQTGRSAMQYRAAWLVNSIAELKQQLSNTYNSINSVKVSKKQQALSEDQLKDLIKADDHNTIAQSWLAGKTINWQLLYREKPQKLHLPSYPFIAQTTMANPWLIINNDWQASPLANDNSQYCSESTLILNANPEQNQALAQWLTQEKIQAQAQINDSTDTIVYFDSALKPLYQFIQTIAVSDDQPLKLYYVSFTQHTEPAREDISALLRSYTMRNPNHQWVMIDFVGEHQQWPQQLLNELKATQQLSAVPQANHIQYRQGQRFAIELQQQILPPVEQQAPIFKQNGVYLIAGALGELGLNLSQCLLNQYQATLILLGRRSQTDAAATLAQLQSQTIHYLSCDVANQSDVQKVAQYIDTQQLKLNGIFHLATASTQHEDNWQQFEQAMQVKVQGTQLLDQAFSHTPLDFMVLFSSMAVFGSLNHLSYSYGNGYQNYFAAKRNSQVTQGKRFGKTLAINWGYWHSNDAVKNIENSFARKKGYDLIEMPQAFPLFASLLSQQQNTLGVIASHDKPRILSNTKQLLQQKPVKAKRVTSATTQASHQQSHQHSQSNNEQMEVATIVIDIISGVIGIAAPDLDLELDLDDYGFDSISLLKTFQQLKTQLSIDLQADAFRNIHTIQSLIDEIEAVYDQSENHQTQTDKQASTPEFILDAGLNLPADTNKLSKVYQDEINTVLLTGATGFLGVHILAETLQSTQATVYCLVRAQSIAHAQQRITQTADKYQLEVDLKRIKPILGDMEQAQLGVSPTDWQLLCDDVQHIIHTAAYVNHIQPYYAFKKSVSGTNQLLKLACSNTIKMIHFASSTTVSNQVENSHFSTNPLEDFINHKDAELILSGYGQSKWVQEENIRLANEKGVPYTVYRFSEIAGSSKTGLGNTDDIFHRLLRMMLNVPVQPQASNYVIDIIPVDSAAAIMVNGMNDSHKRNTVFNVANSQPMHIADFYRYAKDAGLSFELGDKTQFIEACQHYANQRQSEDDRIIMQGLLTARPGYDEYLFETYFMPLEPYHKDNFLQFIKKHNIELVDWQVLFNRYFEVWIDSSLC